MIKEIDLTLPPVNKSEVLRYLEVNRTNHEIDALISQAIALVQPTVRTKAAYRLFNINVNGEVCDLGFTVVRSHSLSRNLDGCGKIALVCATVGLDVDRLIKRYTLTQPSLAHVISAVGSERIEALMDSLSCVLKQSFGNLRPRFSAGYGDLDLSVQRDVFLALQPERSLGLTLNESLIMSPSKSVSAIIGIMDNV